MRPFASVGMKNALCLAQCAPPHHYPACVHTRVRRWMLPQLTYAAATCVQVVVVDVLERHLVARERLAERVDSNFTPGAPSPAPFGALVAPS